MKLSDLKIDPVRRQEGDWVPLEGLDGEIKVRGARNFDWLKVQEDEARRIRRESNVSGPLDQRQQREILIECILQAGLVGWRGKLFTKDDGTPFEYSPDNAATLFKDPAYELLVNITSQACEGMAYASDRDEAKAAKN